MPEIKLQEEAYVATIRRQDSDLNITYDESANSLTNSPLGSKRPTSPANVIDKVIPKPERPRLDLRFSNADFTSLQNVRTSGHQDTLPTQIRPEKRLMTARNPSKNLSRMITIFCWQIASGFSDAAPGAILPYMEEYYDLSYTLVSLIWMSNAAGFIFVACISHKIQAWFGKSKSMAAGCVCSIIMYSIISTGSRFPLIVVGFFFGGMGIAVVSAQANVFLVRMEKSSKYLSLCHSSYGVGATISPIIATSIISAGVPWHYFYLILLGLMVLACGSFLYTFHGANEDLAPFDHEEGQPLLPQEPSEEQGIGLDELSTPIGARTPVDPETPPKNRDTQTKKKDHEDLVDAIKSPMTWLLACFVLLYQGSEVGFAGWIVTFLLDYRGGPASVGYVASGFWAGLTIGRLVLTRPCHKYFGIRRSVIVGSALSIVVVALVWAIPNVFVAGVLTAIAGVTSGPNFPLMITICDILLPRKIQVPALTIITAFGSSGGALFPFLVGILSQRLGTFVVLPTFIILYSLMLAIWIALPNKERTMAGKPNHSLIQKFW